MASPSWAVARPFNVRMSQADLAFLLKFTLCLFFKAHPSQDSAPGSGSSCILRLWRLRIP